MHSISLGVSEKTRHLTCLSASNVCVSARGRSLFGRWRRSAFPCVGNQTHDFVAVGSGAAKKNLWLVEHQTDTADPRQSRLVVRLRRLRHWGWRAEIHVCAVACPPDQ